MPNTELEERDAAANAVAVAPRVTLEQIQSLVASERYFVDDTLTICVLTLKNGFKVTGESAAADPSNFNEELSKKIAREKAVAAIWPLAGFLLRDALSKGGSPAVRRCKVVLGNRSPQAWMAENPGGRTITNKEGKEVPDPLDGANYAVQGEKLSFHPVSASYGADGESSVAENRIFGKYSPSITMEMVVKNPHVLANLEQGRAYYVDFIPAV